MREIYLDNAATTRCFPEVAELSGRIMQSEYGNPSSRHGKGLQAERLVRAAREQVAATLKAQPKEIFFTSGGTESNNTALIGAALARKRKGGHLITSSIEHAAVYQPLEFLTGYLTEYGFELTVLPVDGQGHISLEALSAAIRPDTILVSIMHVNNEIGAVEPIAEIGRIIKERNPATLFHTDAIQSYGKFELRPKRDKIDLLSISGHKLHAPKGVGVLYIGEGVRIRPLLYGGGQQEGMRSGTHNVPGIAGIGLAAEMMYGRYREKAVRLSALKDRFIDMVSELPEVYVHSEKGDAGAPQIVSASFAGIRAEVLLHALGEKGIYVSSGSACSSNHPGISGTLQGIGVPRRLLESTLRFSFSVFNEMEEVDLCIEALREQLPILRRFTRH